MTDIRRRGRPPQVQTTGEGEFTVKVRGQKFTFRQGGDGKVRALGNPERNEDYAFAREQVTRHIATASV